MPLGPVRPPPALPPNSWWRAGKQPDRPHTQFLGLCVLSFVPCCALGEPNAVSQTHDALALRPALQVRVRCPTWVALIPARKSSATSSHPALAGHARGGASLWRSTWIPEQKSKSMYDRIGQNHHGQCSTRGGYISTHIDLVARRISDFMLGQEPRQKDGREDAREGVRRREGERRRDKHGKRRRRRRRRRGDEEKRRRGGEGGRRGMKRRR